MIITRGVTPCFLSSFRRRPFGRLCIAAALDQDIEHDTVLIHGTPEPMLPGLQCADHDLIKVPHVAWCRKTPADLVGKALTEFQRLLPHGFMADQDPSGAASISSTMRRAERKPEIQSDSMADHFSWESVTGVVGMTGLFHPSIYTIWLPYELS